MLALDYERLWWVPGVFVALVFYRNSDVSFSTTAAASRILRQLQRFVFYNSCNVLFSTTAATSRFLKQLQSLVFLKRCNVSFSTSCKVSFSTTVATSRFLQVATSRFLQQQQRLVFYNIHNVLGLAKVWADVYLESCLSYSYELSFSSKFCGER